jgi:hypothetical protein
MTNFAFKQEIRDEKKKEKKPNRQKYIDREREREREREKEKDRALVSWFCRNPRTYFRELTFRPKIWEEQFKNSRSRSQNREQENDGAWSILHQIVKTLVLTNFKATKQNHFRQHQFYRFLGASC